MRESNAKPTVASFFAGIGGFDLGFERAGFQVVFQCEKDAFCQKVLRKHWTDVPLHEDIGNLAAADIPEADVWTAGFPCQDLSLANQGRRKGLNGERSGLFDRFADLAREFPPEWIVLENVPGLLNSHDGDDFRHVLSTLDELGYCLAWRVLDAQHFGTPQRRRRVFVVASYQSSGAAQVLFGAGALGEVALSRRSSSSEPGSLAKAGVSETDVYAIQHATIGRSPDWSGPQGQGFRNDGKTYTLDSRGSSDVVCAPNDGFRVRASSRVSRELDGRRLRACGNAVPVSITCTLAERILSAINTRSLEKVKLQAQVNRNLSEGLAIAKS